jgi:hypothetical protein
LALAANREAHDREEIEHLEKLLRDSQAVHDAGLQRESEDRLHVHHSSRRLGEDSDA